MALVVPLIRSTAASPPGPITVLVLTVESYWRYAHALLAMVGDDNSCSSVHAGSRSSGSSGVASGLTARSARMSLDSRAWGEYDGQSVTSLEPGNSATTLSPSVTR